MYNKTILVGRLTADPTIRSTSSGKTVAQFTLAVDRPFLNPQGQREADFIPIVVWGKAGELVGQYTKKGHRILVEGRLQIRNYEDKSGNKKWIPEIICSQVKFLEKVEKPKNMADMGTDVTNNMPFDETVPF